MLTYFKTIIEKMISSVSLKSNLPPEAIKSPEQIIMETEASELIKNGEYKVLFELVSHGYEITSAQKKIIELNVGDYISGSGKSEEQKEKSIKLDALLACGYELNVKEVSDLIFNSTFTIFCSQNLLRGKTYKNLNDKTSYYWEQASIQVLKAIDREEVQISTYNRWKEEIEKYLRDGWFKNSSISYPWELMNKHWIEKITASDYSSIMQAFSKENGNTPKSLKNDFELMYREHNSLTPQDLVERAKKLYANKELSTIDSKIDDLIKNSLTASSIQGVEKAIGLSKSVKASTNILADKIRVSRLGEKADTLIGKIIIELGTLSQKELEPQNIFTVKNISEKVLPETVQKYLSIDVEYRKEMKNREGKNAYDLLCESLTNIHATLLTLSDLKNQNQLNQMAAQALYTKRLTQNK